MKVLFINTPQDAVKLTRDMAGGLGFDATSATILPPLDFAILAAILRKAGHRVKIIDPEVELLAAENVFTLCAKEKPEVIITSFSLPSLVSDAQFAKELKTRFGVKVYAKSGITFAPILKKFLLDSRADACLVGEPEFEMDNILKGKTERGLAFIKRGKLVINMPEPVKELDSLPLPARDLLHNSQYRYPLLGPNTTTIQSSRGCPYACGYYCPYPLVQGRLWRPMSVERVYRELVDIVKKHKIKRVLFRDATFTLDQKRAAQICQQIIANKLKFNWWCETRLNCLNEDLLKLMKKAGCLGMNVGVETGDDEVMKKQGKPGVDLAMLKNIKGITDKLGLKLHYLLLIGLPEESRKTLFSTFDMIRRLQPYSLGVTVMTPYPGTALYDDAVRKGWIESTDWSRYSGNIINMHTDNLRSWEMKFYQKLIQGEMYLLRQGLFGKIGLFIEEILFRALAIV